MDKKLEHILLKHLHNQNQLMYKLLKVRLFTSKIHRLPNPIAKNTEHFFDRNIVFFLRTINSLNIFVARDGSRILQRLTTEQRKIIINKMASNLVDYSKDILQANKRDLENAAKDGLKSSLLGRLGLSEKKLKTLSIGLQQIAEKADVLGLFKKRTNYLLNTKTKSSSRTNYSTNSFS